MKPFAACRKSPVELPTPPPRQLQGALAEDDRLFGFIDRIEALWVTVQKETRINPPLFGQGNQSSYIRALIDADIMARSLPEQYGQSFKNIRNAGMNALDESLTKELRQGQQDQDGAALSDPTKNQS